MAIVTNIETCGFVSLFIPSRKKITSATRLHACITYVNNNTQHFSCVFFLQLTLA